jgi:hypothetical protein
MVCEYLIKMQDITMKSEFSDQLWLRFNLALAKPNNMPIKSLGKLRLNAPVKA